MSTTMGGFETETGHDPFLELMRPQPTGGLIVTFREGIDRDLPKSVLKQSLGGLAIRSVSIEAEGAMFNEPSPALVLQELGIAYLSEDAVGPEASAIAMALEAEDSVQEVRPEFYLFALGHFVDTARSTWGVEAVGALESAHDGAGIRIAVLDTGIDAAHPDFMRRNIVSRSFVASESADDGHGHGTHCAGTACGGPTSASNLRYGVAPSANLYVGKVLSNAGVGRERDVQAGMAWAIANGCEVISMSLGRSVRTGEIHSPDYERIGRLALSRGSLIVAAAGNDSKRQYGWIAPLNAPANSPSILAVAAVDPSMRVATFSCGGINPGADVDLAAPGVDIFSSVPRPQLYKTLSGTSMACPHVAGAAALWAQSDPALRGRALWNRLITSARPLQDSPRDVGHGLVQCP